MRFKKSFNDLIINMDLRLSGCKDAEQVKYLFGFFMGYREAAGYTIKSAADKSDLEYINRRFTDEYIRLKRSGK